MKIGRKCEWWEYGMDVQFRNSPMLGARFWFSKILEIR